MPDGSVIFSEINANRLIKIDKATVVLDVPREHRRHHRAQFDRQGRLYAAVVPWGTTKFSIIYPEAAKKVVIDNYDGKAFGRPNDLDDREKRRHLLHRLGQRAAAAGRNRCRCRRPSTTCRPVPRSRISC